MTARTIDTSASRRLLVSKACIFRRISSSDIGFDSVCWSCQIFFGSFMGNSSGMGASLVKPPLQDVLDPMDLHRDVGRGKPGDFSGRICVQTLEVGDDNLPVER